MPDTGNPVKRLWHRLAHLTGTYTGLPISFWSGDGVRLGGFECGYCHEVFDLHVRERL